MGLAKINNARLAAVVVVVIVIVATVTIYAAVRDADLERALEPEGQHGVAGNVHGASACLASLNRAYDGPDDAVISSGFLAIHVCPDRVAIAINIHRFQVDDQIVIRLDSDHELNPRAPGYRQPAVIAAHVLIRNAGVDPVVTLVRID